MRVAAFFIALSMLVCAGCSSHKTTVTTDSGSTTVTTSDDNKTMTVDTKEGKVTVGDVDASKLGAPVYPGAVKADSAGYSVQGEQSNSMMATFKTTDDFEKVYQYYKSQLPANSEKMKMSNDGESMATFSIQTGGADTSVNITSKSGETQILIMHKDGKA